MKVFPYVIAVVMLAVTGGAQTNANSLSAMRSWSLKSGTNLVCRVTGFSEDSKSALIVLTNRVRASLPLAYLTEADLALLLKYKKELDEAKQRVDLDAQLKALQSQGYIEFTSGAAKAYPERFDGASVYVEGSFDEITDVFHDSGYLSDTGTQEQNELWFQLNGSSAGTYVTCCVAKARSMPLASPDRIAQAQAMENTVMGLKRGDKIRVSGSCVPEHNGFTATQRIYVDQIILLKTNSADNSTNSDHP
jgi:hypothetical protein